MDREGGERARKANEMVIEAITGLRREYIAEGFGHLGATLVVCIIKEMCAHSSKLNVVAISIYRRYLDFYHFIL